MMENSQGEHPSSGRLPSILSQYSVFSSNWSIWFVIFALQRYK